MKFDLTLTTILVFFVPGVVFLAGLPQPILSSIDLWTVWHNPQDATQGVLLLSAVFLCGALIDSARTILIQPLVSRVEKIMYRSSLPKHYFKSINKDSIAVFDIVIQRAYEYLRLNQNLTCALLIITILKIVETFWSTSTLVALIATLFWFYISVRSQRDLNWTLGEFVAAFPA
jgi:hypothetical protein